MNESKGKLTAKLRRNCDSRTRLKRRLSKIDARLLLSSLAASQRREGTRA